ncbi:putative pyruvate formate lyase activating enzyme [Buchnera aphidicola (Cinara tujafilina)]|uniref:Dual-specificity RNA methyltransferase RlmN n=1 Tax=Buchnera aphidicola (Cinara tujafilina) TaxID=261317 RepID=F7WZB2_9GAMM|nr:bifunctional tRNA (adenosine(37)-C2)-methyltransferase TrmG/ribosomal RNA large subunit methyltransferase RlmN [Buchnera aphidicola]AEH39772.1 putative pyruvate formate lyase activating enzyme [Buchnera aphidicola (Cinara tujafilina)]
MIYNTNLKNKKINLLNFNLIQMKEFFLSLGEKKFRALQLMDWIYKKYCCNFNFMDNFSDILKKKLNEIAIIKPPQYISKKISMDGTIKWNFFVDSGYVETIYIPEKNRSTLCISSQIGCVLKCNFCATGNLGFTRNLLVSEIIGQIWYIMNIIYHKSYINFSLSKITNIVMMGMGEPLLNLKNVIPALHIILSKYGFSFSKHKVTLSTAGIVPAIKKICGKIDVSLAISLHASNDLLRNTLMPINKKFNISSLLTVVKEYLNFSKANRSMVTIEYVMLKNINDSITNAFELVLLLKNISCKINLIPWNPIKDSTYQCSTVETILKFSEYLVKRGLIVKIRKNRGSDIYAACGQLSGLKNIKNN